MSIEYDKDVAKLPTYLEVDFFEEVAEHALRLTNLRIERIQLSMGSTTGENYCSQIYRAKLHYKTADDDECRVLPVIIKSMPHSNAAQFLRDLEVFLKEKISYSEVIPRMEMLLEDSKEKFAARLYHSLKLPINTIAFEDLGRKDFEMASRENGLNEAHALLVIKRLAQFHATSMVLAKKYPELMKCYTGGLLCKAGLQQDDGMLMRFFGGNAAALVDLVSTWPGYETIAQKLQHYVANLRDNLCRSQEQRPGEWRVLNHGDLWVNNILFKYDEQRQPQDVIFLDFQMSIWCSPGIDLNYFFYTSLQLELLQHGREALLKAYHNKLSATLRRLNYADVPSFQQVREEVRRRESYGFFASYGVFPTISMDKEMSSDNSLDNFADEEFARNKLKQMFASKRLEQTFRYTLPNFDKLKIWD